MQMEETGNGTLEIWTPDEVVAAFSKGEIVLIDVRTPQEYLMERIPGAMNYPMQDFTPNTLPGEAVKQIVFLCGSGVRSERVSRMVLAAGHDKVAHLQGGFGAWKQAGLPHVTIDMATGAPKRVGDAGWLS